MAKFWTAQSDGSAVIMYIPGSTPNSPPSAGSPPANAAYQVDFDPSTNAGLIQQYSNDPNLFTMVAGTLAVDGTPATIAPASPLYAAKTRFGDQHAKAINPDGGSFTRQEDADVRILLKSLVGL